MTSTRPHVAVATITIKAHDAPRLARFWRDLLGYVVAPNHSDSARLEDPVGSGPTILIQPTRQRANTGDPDGGANATAQLVLSPDEDRRDQDFGFRGVGRIGDRVWYDRDGDGVQASTGEPGVAGATLVLVWAGPDQILGNSDDRSFTTVTDSAGLILRNGMAPPQGLGG